MAHRRKRWPHDAAVFDVFEVAAVMDALTVNRGTRTPHWQKAFRLWLICWQRCAEHYRDTAPGASLLVPGDKGGAASREELARDVDCTVAEVSRLMTALEEIGVITRERSQPSDPDQRVRGRGFVAYTVHHLKPN